MALSLRVLRLVMPTAPAVPLHGSAGYVGFSAVKLASIGHRHVGMLQGGGSQKGLGKGPGVVHLQS